MNKTFKKIWNIVAWCLVGIVVILAILLAGIRVFGFQVFAVLSGSMEPEFMTGSLIYVREVDTDTLKEKDIITFMLDKDTVATHRIVGIVQSEEDPTLYRFRTKGDANEMEDGTLVHPNNVVGKPAFSIPYLGYLANFIQNPPGTYIAISVGAILILLVFLPDLLDEDEDKKNGKKKKKEDEEEATVETNAPVPRPGQPRPKPPVQQPRRPRPVEQENVPPRPAQPMRPVQAPAQQPGPQPRPEQPAQPRMPEAREDDILEKLRRMTPEQLEQLKQRLTPEQMVILKQRIARARQRAQQNTPPQN